VFKHLFEDVVDFSRRMGYNFDQAFESNTRSEPVRGRRHGSTTTRIDDREAQR
jgi:hypothetical protein